MISVIILATAVSALVVWRINPIPMPFKPKEDPPLA